MFLIAQAKIQLLQDKLVCGSPTGRHHHSTGHLVILFVAAALHNTSERLEKKKKKQTVFICRYVCQEATVLLHLQKSRSPLKGSIQVLQWLLTGEGPQALSYSVSTRT